MRGHGDRWRAPSRPRRQPPPPHSRPPPPPQPAAPHLPPDPRHGRAGPGRPAHTNSAGGRRRRRRPTPWPPCRRPSQQLQEGWNSLRTGPRPLLWVSGAIAGFRPEGACAVMQDIGPAAGPASSAAVALDTGLRPTLRGAGRARSGSQHAGDPLVSDAERRGVGVVCQPAERRLRSFVRSASGQ